MFVDLSSVPTATKGLITLTMDAGFMQFAFPPYDTNSPVVVFDHIASCGAGCTSIGPVTVSPENQTYNISPVPEPNTLFLLGAGVTGLGLRHRLHHRRRII
jgi:hypothetical protein